MFTRCDRRDDLSRDRPYRVYTSPVIIVKRFAVTRIRMQRRVSQSAGKFRYAADYRYVVIFPHIQSYNHSLSRARSSPKFTQVITSGIPAICKMLSRSDHGFLFRSCTISRPVGTKV